MEQAQEQLQAQAGEELDSSELQTLEETMYGDIWQREDCLNWLYERLLAIKEVMSETATMYLHLDLQSELFEQLQQQLRRFKKRGLTFFKVVLNKQPRCRACGVLCIRHSRQINLGLCGVFERTFFLDS